MWNITVQIGNINNDAGIIYWCSNFFCRSDSKSNNCFDIKVLCDVLIHLTQELRCHIAWKPVPLNTVIWIWLVLEVQMSLCWMSVHFYATQRNQDQWRIEGRDLYGSHTELRSPLQLHKKIIKIWKLIVIIYKKKTKNKKSQPVLPDSQKEWMGGETHLGFEFLLVHVSVLTHQHGVCGWLSSSLGSPLAQTHPDGHKKGCETAQRTNSLSSLHSSLGCLWPIEILSKTLQVQ